MYVEQRRAGVAQTLETAPSSDAEEERYRTLYNFSVRNKTPAEMYAGSRQLERCVRALVVMMQLS
ncbi:unnamed protein product [Gongylonema pulchrum]|uniref:Four helix bundle protein n=1 Tax=Gongylonema pulchrum TaxID=637853 RepID=A0A183EAS6_9BILA|nr:unnamed protein product [Gongylonema pulchrum]